MNGPYRLYGWPGSGAFAVQVALEEAGAAYERVWVQRDEAGLAAFRRLNPTGRAPALDLGDGTVIFESAAMLIHLSLCHPQARLAPAPGSALHARFLQWMVFCSANLYEPVLRMYYAERYSSRGEADAAGIREKAGEQFLASLTLIEQELRPYLLGEQYSVADTYLYMLASWWSGDRAALHERLPHLGAHAALMAARPAVGRVEADHAA